MVLLPPSWRSVVERVELHDSLPPSGASRIESGRFTGDTHNGGRPHFRFSEPGQAYGGDLYVVAYGRDGETHTWHIPRGADRVE